MKCGSDDNGSTCSTAELAVGGVARQRFGEREGVPQRFREDLGVKPCFFSLDRVRKTTYSFSRRDGRVDW